jgi:hypothetical protein
MPLKPIDGAVHIAAYRGFHNALMLFVQTA